MSWVDEANKTGGRMSGGRGTFSAWPGSDNAWGGSILWRPPSKQKDINKSYDLGAPSSDGFSQANSRLHNREAASSRAGRDVQDQIDTATEGAQMRAAEMGMDYNPDDEALMKGAASKAGAMTGAGWNVDRENVGIQNQFALQNANMLNNYNLAQDRMALDQDRIDAGREANQSQISFAMQKYRNERNDALSEAKERSKYAGLDYNPETGKITDVQGMFDRYLDRRRGRSSGSLGGVYSGRL